MPASHAAGIAASSALWHCWRRKGHGSDLTSLCRRSSRAPPSGQAFVALIDRAARAAAADGDGEAARRYGPVVCPWRSRRQRGRERRAEQAGCARASVAGVAAFCVGNARPPSGTSHARSMVERRQPGHRVASHITNMHCRRRVISRGTSGVGLCSRGTPRRSRRGDVQMACSAAGRPRRARRRLAQFAS